MEPVDESTHLLSRDINVTSRGVDVSEDFQPSSVDTFRNVGGRRDNLSRRSFSLLPTNGSHHDRPGIQRSLPSNVKRMSNDGVLGTYDSRTGGGGGVADGSRASLLSLRSTLCRTSNYGTLYAPVSHKRSSLSRLSFAEVLERVTLTWQDIDVYAPPTRSKSIILRGLCASSASADSIQPKHILKDGRGTRSAKRARLDFLMCLSN